MTGLQVLVLVAPLLSLISGQTIQCPVDKAPIPDSNNCVNYYNCSSGVAVSASCPSGQYYNCMNQACGVNPWLTCCMNDPNAPDVVDYNCSKNGTNAPNPFYCGMYFQCLNGEITDGECAYGQEFSDYNHACLTASTGDCVGTTTTSIASTTTTSSPTSTTTTTTPTSTTTTTSPTSTTTTTTPTPTTTTTSPTSTTTTTSPTSTTTMTSPTLTTTTTRPTSTNSTTTSTSTSTSTSSTSTTTAAGQTCSTNNTVYSNKNNCRQYYQCENGVTKRYTCPRFQTFNCWTGKCQYGINPTCCITFIPPFGPCWNFGKTTANPKDCSTYYQCSWGWIWKKRCSSGQKFDAWKRTCVASAQASCAS